MKRNPNGFPGSSLLWNNVGFSGWIRRWHVVRRGVGSFSIEFIFSFFQERDVSVTTAQEMILQEVSYILYTEFPYNLLKIW
jgi:hypothetical protein